MDCVNVRQALAIPAEGAAASVQAHLAGCPACASWARTLREVDEVARPALIVAPPAEVALRLAELAAVAPIVTRTTPHRFGPEWLLISATLVALIAAQVYALSLWAGSAIGLSIGDIPVALIVLLGSPGLGVGTIARLAQDYLAGLGMWLLLGAALWVATAERPVERLTRAVAALRVP